jgi:alpha-tubulin suppressor-like RCC1 family protein
MITNSRQGVFALEDAYKKIASGCWVYDGNSDPGANTLWMWGDNYAGQLGQSTRGSNSERSSPVQIPGTSWCVFNSRDHILATKSEGTLWAWGSGGHGKLGNNNVNSTSSPVQVPGTAWNNVSAGGTHSAARKTDGTLWVWGRNYDGQLGQSNRTYTSSPVQVPGTSWCGVTAGQKATLALKTDGTLWAWGEGYSGVLGFVTNYARCSPVQIPGNSWIEVDYEYQSVMARKTDGTAWVWGSNAQGQLGINCCRTGIGFIKSPVQLPGSAWSDIAMGWYHSMARKTDGTLWTMGENNIGQLGNNTQGGDTCSPVQIPGTSWNDICTIDTRGSMGRKTDGTLWVWGCAGYGLLGDNTSVPKSSPIQIPGTQWSAIAGRMARKSVP